ncbi:MAG TPA: chorismate-binding protein, partial [Gemmatimonadaceae bacterium]|nr:chorismate-binding protein [Gemmatimonadaceae bacterium]
MTDSSSPLAIVDFADEIGSSPRRLEFSSPVAVRRADRLEDVVAVLDAADRAARDGRWVVGFVSFEAATAFDPAFAHAPGGTLPLAWFGEFDAPSLSGGTPSLPDEPMGGATAVPLAPVTPVGDKEYASAVQRIHAYIDAGDVYQVNYTVPFTSPLAAAPRAVYERMRAAQGGSYSCYLDTGDAHILSASPELFFERRGAWLRSRPMKGTAPRGAHPAADADARDALLRSDKDRAENVMIVDVVRNDLGRLARVGTVRVAALCEPERYPSVWQLTSTVEAEVDPHVSLARVFAALFPPASVTGAPKIRATAIIRELERGAREVYCGAVGIVRPGGDATFNVAIRTAWTTSTAETLHLGAGGGITTDSTVHGELGEVRAKLAAFTQRKLTPALFETIRIERGTPVRFERHLARLGASADRFDIPFDVRAARHTLDAALRAAAPSDLARARL